MVAKQLITVLGITGTQGSSVANAFIKNSTWQIRGITRNPASDKAKAWAQRGAEVVQADLDDVESLKRAFRGASAIFAVTDYVANYSRVDGDHMSEQEKGVAAGKLEQAQGINVATAASDPEVLATLERFVFSTLPAITALSGGKYTHGYEFDAKAIIERYIREEKPELGKRMSTVTMGSYQENWRDESMRKLFAPVKQQDGIYHLVRFDWLGNHVEHPEVVASRDMGAFVEALVLQHPPGTNVLGATQIISKDDYATLWGRILGVKTVVKDLPVDEFAKYIPEELWDTLLDFYRFISEYGYTGGRSDVKTPAELGIQTSSLEEFIKGEDWSVVLKGNY